MNQLELEFRRNLLDQMDGLWYHTVHAESPLYPGCPDISYIMIQRGCETGWLELKAPKPANQLDVHVESSQHGWIGKRHDRVPVHFLIDTGRSVCLVNGGHHAVFAKTIKVADLECLSDAVLLPHDNWRVLARALIKATTRR